MKKEVLFRRAFFSMLLFLAIAGTQFVNLVLANPYMYQQVSGPVSPPPWVEPPSISIFSPENNTEVSNSVSLDFNLSVVIPVMPELFYYYLSLTEVYYKASWLSNNTYLDLTEVKHSIPNRTRTFSEDSLAQWGTYWTLSEYELNPNFSIELKGIPEGPQSIEVFAVERGLRKTSQSGLQIYYGKYTLVDSSTVHFTVDNTAPYAEDPAGNVGTLVATFTVATETEYPQATSIGIAVGASLAVVAVSLTLYLKKRENNSRNVKKASPV